MQKLQFDPVITGDFSQQSVTTHEPFGNLFFLDCYEPPMYQCDCTLQRTHDHYVSRTRSTTFNLNITTIDQTCNHLPLLTTISCISVNDCSHHIKYEFFGSWHQRFLVPWFHRLLFGSCLEVGGRVTHQRRATALWFGTFPTGLGV